jgi:hypothetical protein
VLPRQLGQEAEPLLAQTLDRGRSEVKYGAVTIVRKAKELKLVFF